MKKFLFPALLCASICAVSCIGGGKYSANYQAVCNFEYQDIEKICGLDGVYFEDNFSGGDCFLFLNKASEDKGDFYGGCAISVLKDSTYAEGHFESLFSVADTTAADGTAFLVYYQSPNMPEHAASFLYSSAGTCTMVGCAVANTNYLVNLATYGNGTTPAFSEGDYLTLTIYGVNEGSSERKSVSVDLIRYSAGSLNALIDWKAVKLDTIGQVDHLDFQLSSNRGDIPLFCCLDLIVSQVSVSY